VSETKITTPGQVASRRETRPDIKVFQKSAVDLLIRFHIVAKNAKLYQPNNEMFQEQAKMLFDSINAFLQEEDKASFQVRQSALFFNDVRLKFVLGTYPIFKFILEQFRVREISSLTFVSGLTFEELARFITVFGRREKMEEGAYEKLVADLADADVRHVAVETVSATETFTSLHKDTARIFFLSILHLKESFERDQRNEKIQINTTRRLMQSIFNHIVDNEPFIHGLTNLKNYDEYTLNHSVNVCMLAIALGRRLGLSRSELVDLGIAAFFHDLGKLDTPIDILNKPAKLSEEEREIMQRHPQQGAEKLIHLKEFRRLPLRAIHVALEHHIKEDHSGYPRFVMKGDINLFSRIVKVVDFFDAVTTRRVYRKKVYTRAEALSLMLEQSGIEFNPVILKAFVNLMGLFPVGTLVALNTGELGIVFDLNSDSRFSMRPKVKLITDTRGNKINGEVVDLSDRNPGTGKFPRTIVRALDPDTYQIEVADYFLAQAQ